MIYICEFWRTHFYIIIGVFLLEAKAHPTTRIAGGLFCCHTNIRHRLNDALLRSGGHVGDGIRPSERGKGLGTELVRLALEECQKLGIRRVLMVCSRENPASARTIQKNGGILENELPVDGVIEQRYWITLGPPDAFSGL